MLSTFFLASNPKQFVVLAFWLVSQQTILDLLEYVLESQSLCKHDLKL